LEEGGVSFGWMERVFAGEVSRTILVIFSLLLVVLAAQFGPFRKVVLGRGVCHFAVESDDFFAEGYAGGGLFGLRDGEFGVEEP
jgi:hypothetical protein